MALTFDHAAKLIGVPQADAQPLTMQALINAIREEEASERGMVYDPIAEATGKDDLGGGVATGITVSLLSSWKISFAAGSYQAAIDGGNLADALARVNNTGSPQVVVRSSAAGTVVTVSSGSGLSGDQDARLARIEKFLRNKQVTDPTTGKMVVYDDDGATPLAQGDLYEDHAGTQPYRGQGAERRERLA